jgi:hypothetical protein
MTNHGKATVFYNDIFFRSLLEAQWAAFFDSISTPYVYRPARFPLSAEPDERWYEPQFFLTEYQSWFEAFPRLDCSELCRLSWALAFVGRIRDCAPPWPSSSESYWLALGPVGADSRNDSLAGIFQVFDVGIDQREAIISGGPSHTWAECRKCGKIQLYGESDDGLFPWADGIRCSCCGLEQTGDSAQRDSSALLRAIRRARSLETGNQSGLLQAPEVGGDAPDSGPAGTEEKSPAAPKAGGPGKN